MFSIFCILLVLGYWHPIRTLSILWWLVLSSFSFIISLSLSLSLSLFFSLLSFFGAWGFNQIIWWWFNSIFFVLFFSFQNGDYHLESRHLTILSPPSGKFTLKIVTEIYPQKNTSLEVQHLFALPFHRWLVWLFAQFEVALSFFSLGTVQVIWEFLHSMWSRGFPQNYILSG